MSQELSEKAAQRLGQRVAGKYHLQQVLGVGGMGVVYAARHEYTERMVALKLLHPSIAVAPTHVQRFLREAKASAAIEHPGIAEVLDAGRDADGTTYVAFELLEGEDLGTAIIERRASPARIIDVAVELLEALGAAHDRRFIHRDIKPANIFLLRAPRAGVRVKLLDFGIARRVQADGERRRGLTQAGAVVGTPYYMSPEQMCGEAVDGRADLWALAVVIYYALSGDLPFRGRTYVALLTEMLKKGPPPLADRPGIPNGTESVLKRALAPRIEDRFPDAASMRAAMQALQPPSADEAAPTMLDPPVAVARRASAPSVSVTAPPTLLEPPWERALHDIEGEIKALEARPSNASPSRRPSRPWFKR